ncbi:hypothetical protein MP638_006277 [Amoeboaphelidium occidentale]|nr:hypothetical protein MP638_006277 [Amoeboaphelidium occidentale]
MLIEIKNLRTIQFFKDRPKLDVDAFVAKMVDMVLYLQHDQESSNSSYIQQFVSEIRSDITKGLADVREKLRNDLDPLASKLSAVVTPIVTSQNKTLKDDMLGGLEKLGETTNEIKQRVFGGSSQVGQLGEVSVLQLLQENLPGAEVNDVSKEEAKGDIEVRMRGVQILVEVKNWIRSVSTAEIEKFRRDCKINRCSGVLLSLSSGVVGNMDNRPMLELCSLDNGGVVPLVIVPNCGMDVDKITMCISVCLEIMKNLDNDTRDQEIHVALDEEHAKQICVYLNESLRSYSVSLEHLESYSVVQKRSFEKMLKLTVDTAFVMKKYQPNYVFADVTTKNGKRKKTASSSVAGYMESARTDADVLDPYQYAPPSLFPMHQMVPAIYYTQPPQNGPQ